MNYLKNIYTLIFLLITGIGLDAQTSTVSGKIVARDGEPMENITLTITTSSQTLTTTTDELGNYSFADIAIDAIISVVPSRDINPLNGVSTFDVVLASKHILGLELLDSPYKLIAADVNNSGTITAIDLIALRKVIAGNETSFPNNSNWRFIPKNFAFSNPQNPWESPFPEFGISDSNRGFGGELIDFIGIRYNSIEF